MRFLLTSVVPTLVRLTSWTFQGISFLFFFRFFLFFMKMYICDFVYDAILILLALRQ